MKSAKIALFILLLCKCFFCFSQNVWTLERCLLYAIENNIQLKQQQLNVQYSKNDLIRAKADVLPNLNAGASQNFRFGRSVDPLTYEFTNRNTKGSSFSANSNMDLFKGLQTIYQISKYKLNLKKSLEDLERAKNDLSLNITRAYLQILFNMELYKIALNQLEITGQQVEQTKKLVEAGSLPGASLLEIQAQNSAEELQVVNSENQLDLSYLNLAQMLDMESLENFNIAVPEFGEIADEEIVYSVLTIYKQAVVGLPQIKSAEYNLQALKKDLSITKGQISPVISVGGNWSTGYSDNIKIFGSNSTMPFRDQIDFAQSRIIGFNLRIPVLNGLSTKMNISNAKISVLNSEYELQIEKNKLFKEIQLAYSDAKAALKKYRASQKTVISLEESFGYIQQRYNIGMVITVDYYLAKNNLTKARSDQLQAKYNYIFNKKILDFYRGNPIKL